MFGAVNQINIPTLSRKQGLIYSGLVLFIVLISLLTLTAKAAAQTCNITYQYPRPCTSNWGTTADVQTVVGYNQWDNCNNQPGNCFLLWDKYNPATKSYPPTHSSVQNTQAQRPEGFGEQYSEFEVGAPENIILTQKTFAVTIVNGCSIETDPSGTGWEDHGYNPNQKNPIGSDLSVDIEATSQGLSILPGGAPGPPTPGGSTTVYGSSQSILMSQSCVGKSGDLIINIPSIDFSINPRYGGTNNFNRIATVVVSIDKGTLDGEKNVSVTANSHAMFVTFMNIASWGGNAAQTAGDTYSPGVPNGGSAFNSMNIGDPRADYFYTDPVPTENFPYGSLNNVPNPQSDYTFVFQPDCTYKGQTVYLKYENADGNPQTQPENFNGSPNFENWTLIGPGVSMFHDTRKDGNGYKGIPIQYPNGKPVVLQAGQTYVWTFHNVDRSHGLTLWMPFSEITTSGTFAKCPQPTGRLQNIPPSCSAVTLYAFDSANWGLSSNWQIFHKNAGPGITYDFGSVSYPSGAPTGLPLATQPSQTFSQPSIAARLKFVFAAHKTSTFYLRMQDPLDGNWYWVNSFNNVTFETESTGTNSPGSTPPGGTADFPFGYGRTFTYSCQTNPKGQIYAADCQAGIWGYAEDASDLSYQADVLVLYQTQTSSGYSSLQPYTYGTTARGTVGSTVTGSYSATAAWNGGHGFAIPIDPTLMDGYQKNFFVYFNGMPNPSFWGMHGPGTGGTGGIPPGWGVSMMACAPFQGTGTTNVTLLPNNQNPNSYTTNSQVQIAYGNTVNPNFDPTVGMFCQVNVTNKSGASMPPNNPLQCSGGFKRSATSFNNNPSGSIVPPPPQLGDRYCPTLNLWYGGNIVRLNGTVFGPPQHPVIPGGCGTVSNEPYFKAYNGAVSTGSDFSTGSGCTGGLLSGWFDNTPAAGTNGNGAGSQLSALANLKITGFGTGLDTNSSSPGSTGAYPGEGLTFANSSGLPSSQTSGSPDLGGLFGSIPCIATQSVAQSMSATPSGGANPASLPGNIYYFDASSFGNHFTLDSLGQQIQSGNSVTIFVDGDVYIPNNITYNQPLGGWNAWNPSTGSNVPSLKLYANGNIYIGPNVTELDGLYQAQPTNANNGVIYTCAGPTGFSSMNATNPAGVLSGCKNQLLVNGSFVARRVSLSRTFGSLRDTLGTESPPNCSNQGSYVSTADNSVLTKIRCASELFQLTPEMFLSTPPTGGSNFQYDQLISLPPVL